ncbi:MAG: hypothetical protein AAFX81_06645 [Pseudomonadota bacterium]
MSCRGRAILVAALAATGAAAPTSAEVIARFVEGAPTDRFVIRNEGPCAIGPSVIVIDLTTAAGGLIFDTTSAGAGVQVFQPFDVAEGAEMLRGASTVTDGDQRIELTVTGLAPGDPLAFTIDVDDTQVRGPLGQTQIAGAEIEGATLTVTGLDAGRVDTGAFDEEGFASVATSACPTS